MNKARTRSGYLERLRRHLGCALPLLSPRVLSTATLLIVGSASVAQEGPSPGDGVPGDIVEAYSAVRQHFAAEDWQAVIAKTEGFADHVVSQERQVLLNLLYLRATAQFTVGHWRGCMATIDRYSSLQSGESSTHADYLDYQRVICLYRLHRPTEALGAIRASLRRSPQSPYKKELCEALAPILQVPAAPRPGAVQVEVQSANCPTDEAFTSGLSAVRGAAPEAYLRILSTLGLRAEDWPLPRLVVQDWHEGMPSAPMFTRLEFAGEVPVPTVYVRSDYFLEARPDLVTPLRHEFVHCLLFGRPRDRRDLPWVEEGVACYLAESDVERIRTMVAAAIAEVPDVAERESARRIVGLHSAKSADKKWDLIRGGLILRDMELRVGKEAIGRVVRRIVLGDSVSTAIVAEGVGSAEKLRGEWEEAVRVGVARCRVGLDSYMGAKQEYRRSNWAGALSLYGRFGAEYPGVPLQGIAMGEQAYCLYCLGRNQEALECVKSWREKSVVGGSEVFAELIEISAKAELGDWEYVWHEGRRYVRAYERDNGEYAARVARLLKVAERKR